MDALVAAGQIAEIESDDAEAVGALGAECLQSARVVGDAQFGLREATIGFEARAGGVDCRVLNVDCENVTFGADELCHVGAVVPIARGGIDGTVSGFELLR